MVLEDALLTALAHSKCPLKVVMKLTGSTSQPLWSCGSQPQFTLQLDGENLANVNARA